MDTAFFSSLGFVLVFVGMTILLVAIILMVLSRSKGRTEVRGGGAIIIGPIPIIFGTDKKSLKIILPLSILLTIALIVLTIVTYFMPK